MKDVNQDTGEDLNPTSNNLLLGKDRFVILFIRAETERDGTRAETRFGFPAKRTSPFKSAGVSVQSAAGRRDVRISGSNAG